MRVAVLLRKLLLNVLLFACAGTAQIAQPKLGAMLARDGSARPVSGVAGSVTLGDSVASGVVSMGCARAGCLFFQEPALIWFDSANQQGSALIYFISTKQLVRWHNDSVSPIPFDVSGEIIAIGDGLFAVRRRSGIWIVRDGDKIVLALPHDTRAVLLIGGEAVYATRHEVVLGDTRFAIENVESLTWLGENYVQARTRDSSYAIRIDPGHEQFFLLPELAPEPQP